MTPDCTIVIPFLNEEDSIRNLASVFNQYAVSVEFSVEAVFVDDGSTDNSLSVLNLALSEARFPFQIVKLSKNFGSHSALRAGISVAKGKYVGFLYADLQDPIELIEHLFNKISSDNLNIVWGSRNSDQNGFFETFFSRGYAYLMKVFVSNEFPENGFDVVMFDTKVRTQINNNPEVNSSIFLQILTLGFSQGHVLYDKRIRSQGKSKWTLSKKIKLLVDSFVAFSYAPIRLVTIGGIFLFFSGLLWSSYIVIRQLMYADLDSGWPTLISVLLIGFGMTNIGLGIVAEYIWRTLDASRKRPVFIVNEIVEINKRS